MIALNHSFVADIATAPPGQAHAALGLIEHVRRRTRALPLVHEGLAIFDWGDGPLVHWANQMLADRERAPLIELLLGMLSGPFVEGDLLGGVVEPPLDALEEWLQDVIRTLLGTPPRLGAPNGLVSPAPHGGADALTFAGGDRSVDNWLDAASFDRAVITATIGETTIDVLRQAEAQMAGQLVLLPSAIRSAEAWTLDCRPADLLRALLGLEAYASALVEGLPREQCAERYRQRCAIEMSQESAATWRMPTRRRQRLFVAASHGEKYFDMHAKPGNRTRVHVWVATGEEAGPVVYVGHCGRHLE